MAGGRGGEALCAAKTLMMDWAGWPTFKVFRPAPAKLDVEPREVLMAGDTLFA